MNFYSHPDRRSDPIFVNEWNRMDERHLPRRFNAAELSDLPARFATDEKLFHQLISKKIKEILLAVDLNEITSKSVRCWLSWKRQRSVEPGRIQVFDQLEKSLQMSLAAHKSSIDELMLESFGQMDPSTPILPYLYLGSEWNASNLDELRANRIGYILNVSREIENFFPEHFQYLNIRVDDEIESDLLKNWDQTNRFINEAK